MILNFGFGNNDYSTNSSSIETLMYLLPEIAETIDRPCRDDTWSDTTTVNAPAVRRFYTAVWTGSEMIVWGGSGEGGISLNTGGKYCLQPPQPPITVNQSNGGEVWPARTVQQMKWDRNLKQTDHRIIQYSRDRGASWFRSARETPAYTFGYWWQVDNFPTT